MRVQVVDPSAYTPPYDHAFCSALARAGAEVELVTSHFPYGSVSTPDGYRRTELFYRHGAGRPGSRARMAAKLLQHPLDMLRLARDRGTALPAPDVRHFQWLAVQPFDARVLDRFPRPVVLTAHDVLPREPKPGQRRAQRRLYDAVDAVVVHSRHGRGRLVEELEVNPAKVSVIPHGAFTHLADRPGERPLDPELAGWLGDGPVALFFGLIRPYKGLDVLLRAWRSVGSAEARLVIAGMPRMDLAPLRELADERVRFVPRFVSDAELPAYFRRADLVVMPYREIDQSGVLATALGFGKPCVVSDVGGFAEVAALGAARVVPPGDERALAAALSGLLGDPADREALAEGARKAAEGPLSWDHAARLTLDLYAGLASR